MLTYLCELLYAYSCTRLPAGPNHKAIIRQLFSVSLWLMVCVLASPAWRDQWAEILSLVTTIRESC